MIKLHGNPYFCANWVRWAIEVFGTAYEEADIAFVDEDSGLVGFLKIKPNRLASFLCRQTPPGNESVASVGQKGFLRRYDSVLPGLAAR